MNKLSDDLHVIHESIDVGKIFKGLHERAEKLEQRIKAEWEQLGLSIHDYVDTTGIDELSKSKLRIHGIHVDQIWT